MGAHFDTVVLEGGISPKEVERKFEKIQKELRWEYGHNGYTGTLAEADGITIPMEPVFPDKTTAEKWLDENADKWGPALAVKYTNPNGELKWYIAAWCSS